MLEMTPNEALLSETLLMETLVPKVITTDTIRTAEAIEYIDISCPTCGSHFKTEIDLTAAGDFYDIQGNIECSSPMELSIHAGLQLYYEDCQICCSPIELSIQINEKGAIESIKTQRGNT